MERISAHNIFRECTTEKSYTEGGQKARFWLALFLFVICAIQSNAQSTRVKGRVTDAETGEGIPFAAVLFKGTTIGIASDLDGYYSIKTRDSSAVVLTAQMLGYETEEVEVRQHNYSEINFALRPIKNTLSSATVKPDNRKAKRLLGNISKFRDSNNPDNLPQFQCDIYSKMELDMTNAEDQLKSKALRRQIGFVFDYMDTSVVSGVPYLPVMISETISTKYHSSDPTVDREVIKASKISGVNEENNNISQYTGSLYLKANFYDNFISAFNISLPSPMAENGDLYYNYYIIDSLALDGRKTYKVRFHPKKGISSPAFDGEMHIDAEDFGLREIHTKMSRNSNVNWVRDFVIDVENQRLENGQWFYKKDNIYIDFSLTKRDSSKMISFLANRELYYSDISMQLDAKTSDLKKMANVKVVEKATVRDSVFWSKARPYALSEKEKNIYLMVDSVKKVPLYRNVYNIVNTLINGYIDTKYVGIGPYSKLVSFNNIEGLHLQVGGRTTAQFSKFIRLSGHLAYSTKMNEFFGAAGVEMMFGKEPTRKLSIDMGRDITQLGKGSSSFSESNIFTSIFAKGGRHKMSPINSYSIRYEHEWSPNFNNTIALESHRVFSNGYVPMFRPDSSIVNSVGMNQLHYMARFSWEESVTRGAFDKYYVDTDYPVITIDLIGSTKGFARNEYSYFRSELSVDYRLRIPPVGFSKFHLNAGNIVGRVPYPMLKLHEGNATYFHDPSSFACMDFYEFASDTWVTLFYEHNFNGFILGKIPFVKRAQLREILTLKAAYGTLSTKNNGIAGSQESENAPLLFPHGMNMLNKPYLEAGVGIGNIFKIFRIDATWRLTHRYRYENNVRVKSPSCFTVTVGAEFRF